MAAANASPSGVELSCRALAREIGASRTRYTKNVAEANKAIRVAKDKVKELEAENARLDQMLAVFKDKDDEVLTVDKIKAIMEAHRKVEEFGGMDVLSRAIEATPRLQSARRCKEKTELNRKYRELLATNNLKGFNVYMVTWTDLLDWRTKTTLPWAYSFVMMMPDVEHPDDNENSKPDLLHVRLALIADGEVNEMYFPPGKYEMAHVNKQNCADFCNVVFAAVNMDTLAQADGLVGGGSVTPAEYIEATKRDSLRMIKSHVRDSYAVLAPFEKEGDDQDRRCRGKRQDYSNGGFGGGYRTYNKRKRGEGGSSSAGGEEQEQDDVEVEVEVEVEADEEDDVEDEEQVVATLAGTAVQGGDMERVDSMVGEEQVDALNTLADQANQAAPASAPEAASEVVVKSEPGTSA